MTRPIAAICVLATLVVPAAAAAQAPPDERAAARAFTDAALQLTAAVERIRPQFEALFRAPPPRCIRRLEDRIPERRFGQVSVIAILDSLGQIGRLLEPPLTQFSLQLHGVQTADPALQAGRTAWRRGRRAFAQMAAIPAIDVCAEVRRYVAGGFEPTPAVKRGLRLAVTFNRVSAGDDFNARLKRATRRLRQLGIPREEARAFAGGTGVTSGREEAAVESP